MNGNAIVWLSGMMTTTMVVMWSHLRRSTVGWRRWRWPYNTAKHKPQQQKQIPPKNNYDSTTTATTMGGWKFHVAGKNASCTKAHSPTDQLSFVSRVDIKCASSSLCLVVAVALWKNSRELTKQKPKKAKNCLWNSNILLNWNWKKRVPKGFPTLPKEKQPSLS